MPNPAARGGRGLCASCNSPEKERIDAELTAGRPLRELAREFGMSAAALSRHRDRHISPSLVVLGTAPRAGGTLLERIESLMGRTERILLAAELGGRGSQAIAAAAQLGRLLELWSKAKGGQDPVIDILRSPQWQEISSAFVEMLNRNPDELVTRHQIKVEFVDLLRELNGKDT